MSKINSGILQNAVSLTEEQEGQLQKEVVADKKAFAYLNSNNELCFALPTEPRCIKELAWDHAQHWYRANGGTGVISMDDYRKSDVGAYYLDRCYYCAAPDSVVATMSKIPLIETPAAAGLASGLTQSGPTITGYSANFIPDSGILYIPAYINDVKITRIYDAALYGCDKITYVNIPPTVTNIGFGAFSNCTNLTHIDLGNCEAAYSTFTSESGGTPNTPFTETPALQLFSVAPNNKKYKSVDGVLFERATRSWLYLVAYPAGKPDAAYTVPAEQNMSLKSYAFYDCTNLTTVNLQNNGIGIARDVFYHCDNITDIISTLTIRDFTYSSYGATFWWQPSDSSKTVTIHCSDGTLTATANSSDGYIYN